MLTAYAAGVNAFLGSGAPLPAEYGLLDAQVDVWEPWHCIAVMRRLGLLMGSVWFKLWRTLALPVVGAENAAKLRYDDGGQDTLCIPPGAAAHRWAADLAALRPAVAALLHAMGTDETGGGSNNWAVGPSRTATGRPILAGDPHRVFEVPGMYAQHHLACDAFDAIGLTVPGVPGFPHYCHNGQVAYCVTHAFVDIHDLFLEQFDAAGQVRVGDGWQPVTTRPETIAVRGEPDRTITVVETRHGPVIAGDPASGAALALRSVQFAETDLSFDCLPRMLLAGDVPSLFAATRGWGLIDHNLVAGDVAGPHRPPGARHGAAPPARQWLAAGAGLDRGGRLAGLDPVRVDAASYRPARRGDRHRQQPRGGGWRGLPVHRLPPAVPRRTDGRHDRRHAAVPRGRRGAAARGLPCPPMRGCSSPAWPR